MTNHKMTEKQIQAALIMFWLGSLVIIAISPEAKQDSWVSSLLAAIMTVPLIFLYIRLCSLYPGKNLFEILLQIFGKIFGRVFILIYVFFSIYLGGMMMKTFSSFIRILNMPETPEPAIILFIILLSVWMVKSGPETIGRMSKYTWPILGTSAVITFLIAIKDMNISNLKPILNTDLKALFSGAFTIFMLPLGEVIVCLSLFSSFDTHAHMSRFLFKGLAMTLTVLLLVNLRNILVLGFPSATMFYFPSYETVSIISIGDFFSRVEVLIGINLMLAGFIKISVCIYTASLGLTKLLNAPDQKPYVVPCSLLMATLSGMLYTNSVEMMDFIKYYTIYAIPFEIIFPLIILIGAEIQTRRRRSDAESPSASES